MNNIIDFETASELNNLANMFSERDVREYDAKSKTLLRDFYNFCNINPADNISSLITNVDLLLEYIKSFPDVDANTLSSEFAIHALNIIPSGGTNDRLNEKYKNLRESETLENYNKGTVQFISEILNDIKACLESEWYDTAAYIVTFLMLL